MSNLLEFVLQYLSQFFGGTGSMENNLVRFSIQAVLWGALLVIAWSRQREQELPREKLLVLGFGLGAASAIVMVFFEALQMLGVIERGATYVILVPLELALAMASVVVVAGAFLRYILDDARLAGRYILVGLGITLACLLFAFWQWPRYLAILSQEHFHRAWVAGIFQLFGAILIIIAILLLRRERGWLTNVVTLALSFFLISDVLFLVNYATDKIYNYIICPIGNGFPILAIPLLGYVYLREQSIEKRKAEQDLEVYRHHLEDLVEERTTELKEVNAQLKNEVTERKLAQAEIAARNADLVAQNAIAEVLSRSLDLEKILDSVLDAVLSVVKMDVGLIFLWDPELEELKLKSFRGPILRNWSKAAKPDWSCCARISKEAIKGSQAIVRAVADCPDRNMSSVIVKEGFETLVSVPLVSKGSAVGALTLGSRQTIAVQPSELKLMTAIGQQIGMAIENAHLYQKAERAIDELKLLHQVSIELTSTFNKIRIYDQIAEQSAKLLNCQMACILDWDNGEKRVKLISSQGISESESDYLQWQLDQSGFQDVLMSCHESIVIGDTRSDPRVPPAWVEKLNIQTLLCVPIWGMNESLGTLILMDRRYARFWRQEEVVLIESFVNRAAVALMNADLHKQLEWSAALEERQQIAADMHDGLAQTVSLLGLQIEEAIEQIENGSNQAAIEQLANTRETVEQVSLDVRRSIASLHGTPKARKPLQELLSNLPEKLAWDEGCPVNFISKLDEPVYLPHAQGDEALLVVQEALMNAQRHGQAQQITLVLDGRGGEIRIMVMDDGIGFEPGKWWQNPKDHFGLGIMHSRAARIGARLHIESKPGEGTRVILSVPMVGGIYREKSGDNSEGAAIQTPARLGIK